MAMPIIFTEIVRGTVQPFENFNAQEDADRLKKAVTGPGTDEDTIIDIIANRTNQQLFDIQNAYHRKYNEGCQTRLFDDFREPYGGEWKMRMLISSRMKTLPERDAEYIKYAIDGAGTDEMALVEIFGTRSHEEIVAIYPKFKTKENLHYLLKDDLGEAQGDRQVLTLLQWIMDPPIKDGSLAADVEYLRPLTYDKVAQLFASRDFQSMQDIFREWEMKEGGSIEHAVKNMSGKTSLAQQVILACISIGKNVHGYFAERLYEAMHGPSTYNMQLIRVITTRCEVDMVQIKKEFQHKYGMSLEAAVEDDTSGDFRNCLIQLITE